MAAAEQIVIELSVDARGAKVGTAEFERAMRAAESAAKSAYDRTIDSMRKATEAQAKQNVQLTGGIQSLPRLARAWDQFRAANDRATAASAKLEKATKLADAAVMHLGVSEAEAAAQLAKLKRELDGTAAAERKFAADLDNTRNVLDRTYASQQRLAQQQAVLNQALKQGEITAGQYGAMMGEANRQHQATVTGQTRVTGGFQGMMGSARQLIPILSGVYAIDKLGQLIKEIALAGSAWQLMDARARMAGSSVQEVYDVSQRTGSALGDTLVGFARLGMAAKDFGASGSEISRVVETVQKLGRVSGATAQEMSAGGTQLAQALASGRLNGDELRSIMENMPAVARQIADGLGVSVGRLRDMGAEGTLTSEKVFGALLAGSKAADAAFAKLPVTLEQAGQRMTNAFTRAGAAIDNSTGLSRMLARGMQSVADTVDTLARRIEGDLTQRIKDLMDQVERGEKLKASANKPANQVATVSGRSNAQMQAIGSSTSNIWSRPVGAGGMTELQIAATDLQRDIDVVMFDIEAKLQGGRDAMIAFQAETKRMNDGLGEMHKAIGLVVQNGKLMRTEEVALQRATDAVNIAIARGGDALKVFGGSAETAKSMLQRMRDQVDPLARSLREMRNEADLLAKPAGFERNLEQRIQQQRAAGATDGQIEAARPALAAGVRDVAVAGIVDAAEQARRAADENERLATAAGAANVSMREALRVNALVAKGYELGLTPAQIKFIASTGKLPQMADGAAVAMRDLNAELVRGDMAKGAAEAKEFGAGASAAARGAMLMAEAAGKGEAAQRAAAAQAAILAERNFGGAEAARQQALEIAAVVTITNEMVREYERSTAASDNMTAAIYAGAEAVEAETVAQERRAVALKLGANETQRTDQIMTAFVAKRASERQTASANETAQIQVQVKGLNDLAAATGQGSAAVAEATINNELYQRARRASLDTVDAFVKAYPKEAQAVRDLAKANNDLAFAQEKAKVERDLTVGRAELALANQFPEVRQRELTLLRAKLDILDKYPEREQAERDQLLKNYEALADINDQLRVAGEIVDTSKGIASDVSGFFVDAFVNVEKKGGSVFDNIWDGALAGGKRFLVKLASLFVEQQLILPIAMQVVGGIPGAFGIRSATGASSTSAAGGGLQIPGFGGLNLFGGSNPLQGILDTPLWGGANGAAVLPIGIEAAQGSVGAITGAGSVGMFTSEAAMAGSGFATGSAAAAAPFTIGNALPGVGAAFSIFNAAQNPNVGTISGAALTTAGAAATMFPAMFGSLAALGPYGLIAGAVLSILGNTLFKQKPSNLGAESSFTFSQLEAGAALDFDRLYRGDKHPGSLSLVDNIALAGQDTLDKLAEEYRDVVFGGTISARYGRKEGASISYGPRDATSVDQWQEFEFDHESEEETAAAFAKLSLAALKDADWSGLGTTVATAVANSAAEDLQSFLADVEFAKGFDQTVQFLNSGLDPVNSQLAQIGKNAKDGGAAFTKTIRDFYAQTDDLFPSITRSFDEAGNEIAASMSTVTQTLSLSLASASQEYDQAATTLQDSSGAVYSFTGAIGDATLQLTDSSGAVLTATLDAATGVYSLATSVEALGGTVATTTTELSTQQEQSRTAGKNFTLGLLGLNDTFRYVHEDGVDVLTRGLFEVQAPLTGMDLALETSRQTILNLRDGAIEAGVSVEELAILIPAALAKAEAEVRAAFARAASAEQFAWTQKFQPLAVPTAEQAFSSVGSTRDATPVFFDTLNSFFLKAGAGMATDADFQALQTNFQNQAGYDILTDDQLNSLFGMVQGALQSSRARQTPAYVPANDNSGGTSSSGGDGGGGGSADDGGRKVLQETIEARRRDLQGINQTIQARERERDSYLSIADGLKKFRESLALSDLSVLTPKQQLDEARRQFEEVYAKALGGDQDAMKDMEGVSRTLLEKSRGYWASSSGQLDKSVRYQEDFARVQSALLAVEHTARDYQAEAVAELVTLNATASHIETEIGNLQQALDNLSTGSPSSPGSPGSPGAPSTPTPPNYDFGYTNLGRSRGQTAADFLTKMFPEVAKVLNSDGSITEQEGYAWAQQLRDPTHLPGLTNAGYYAAAIKAGFAGPFTAGTHNEYLRPGGVWNDGRIQSFITKLREYTTVPSGYFGGYAFAGGGEVPHVPGLTQIGRDSYPAMLMPRERVITAEQNLWFDRVQASHSNDNSAAIVRLLEAVVVELRAEIRQNEAATKLLASKVAETTAAVVRSKPRQYDPGAKARAA